MSSAAKPRTRTISSTFASRTVARTCSSNVLSPRRNSCLVLPMRREVPAARTSAVIAEFVAGRTGSFSLIQTRRLARCRQLRLDSLYDPREIPIVTNLLLLRLKTDHFFHLKEKNGRIPSIRAMESKSPCESAEQIYG